MKLKQDNQMIALIAESATDAFVLGILVAGLRAIRYEDFDYVHGKGRESRDLDSFEAGSAPDAVMLILPRSLYRSGDVSTSGWYSIEKLLTETPPDDTIESHQGG